MKVKGEVEEELKQIYKDNKLSILRPGGITDSNHGNTWEKVFKMIPFLDKVSSD